MDLRIQKAASQEFERFWDYSAETVWNDIPEAERRDYDHAEFEQAFRKVAEPIVRSPQNVLYIAQIGGEFAGYIVIGPSHSPLGGKVYGFIWDLYVAKAFRRNGVGTALVETAVRFCREQGYQKVRLETAAHNSTAQALYEKLGFHPERLYLGKSVEG